MMERSCRVAMMNNTISSHHKFTLNHNCSKDNKNPLLFDSLGITDLICHEHGTTSIVTLHHTQ